MKTVAVIPAYNEERTIADVLARTRPFVDELIVIDDGSDDRTGLLAQGSGARVWRHVLNRGLGAALATGFAAALRQGAEAIVTLDADGQHDPAEIPQFIAALANGADLVIGSRFLSSGGAHGSTMPWHRKCANSLGNTMTFCLFGAWVSDSQSGFRALTGQALRHLDLRTNRMEVSSELIAEARRLRWQLAEIPIQPIYTAYSLSKGQSFSTGVKTLLSLVLRRVF